MHIFQIEDISFKPLTVTAADFDAAADMFTNGLRAGLGEVPNVAFAVSKWMNRPSDLDAYPWKFVRDGRAGIVSLKGKDRIWRVFHTGPGAP
jgi:hypothetical protein